MFLVGLSVHYRSHQSKSGAVGSTGWENTDGAEDIRSDVLERLAGDRKRH